MEQIDFRKINFGFTDATKEVREDPNLLINGYVEPVNLIDKAINSSIFLFLGYKGSGKSALSEHLQCVQNQHHILVDQITLKDFSYKNLSKIVSGNSEAMLRSRQAWGWLLTIKALYNLQNISDAITTRSADIEETINVLMKYGLFPINKINDLVIKSSNIKFKANIFDVVSLEKDVQNGNAEMDFSLVSSYIKELLESYSQTTERQLMIIDGLDDILSNIDSQFLAIAALINEVNSLNDFFYDKDIPVKIIILCRTDIFNRLNDPNKNKIKMDSSYSFNWYQEGVLNQKDCDLIKIANKRTNLIYKDIEDVFQSFFPQTFDNRDIYSALLDFTRHTPRDFIQLLKSIQEQCTTPKVLDKNIYNGIKAYSQNYFLGEIRDEMAGYLSIEEIENVIKLLTSMHRHSFRIADVKKTMSECGIKNLNIEYVFKILYDCSAIGNTYDYKVEKRITYKYRNRTSIFNINDKIIVHKGLWKALNL